MNRILHIILAAAFFITCQDISAATPPGDGSEVIQLLESNRKSRRLEGGMLRIARPIIKKTPMGYVMDKITMMIVCPVEENDNDLVSKAETLIKDGYTLAGSVMDEEKVISLYVDEPKDGHCRTLILRSVKPDNSIMVFKGDFTVEELQEVGRRSEEEGRQRRQARKSQKGK